MFDLTTYSWIKARKPREKIKRGLTTGEKTNVSNVCYFLRKTTTTKHNKEKYIYIYLKLPKVDNVLI